MGYYDEIAGSYDELHRAEQKRKLAIIQANLDVRPSDKLLDVGCGTGISMEGWCCSVMGIDPCLGLLKRCRRDQRILCASAEDIPFLSDAFDIVISLTAMQNFADLEQGLREIHRVGKRDFGLSILKRSPKSEAAKAIILTLFSDCRIIEEDKDMIFLCRK